MGRLLEQLSQLGLIMATTTTVTAPWKKQQAFILEQWKRARKLYGKDIPGFYGTNPEDSSFGAGIIAGFDPEQQKAQEDILDYTGGPQVANMQKRARRELMRGYSGAHRGRRYGSTMYGGKDNRLGQRQYGRLTPFASGQYKELMAGRVPTGKGTPYGKMETALTQGVQKRLNEDILPGIRSGMISHGQQGGGTRGDLVQNAAIAREVEQGLTQPLAQMYGSAYQQAQGMRMPAARMGLQAQQYGMQHGLSAAQQGLATNQQMPMVQNAPLSMFSAANQVGTARRQLTQAGIDADRQRYEYESARPYNTLAMYQGATSGNWGSQQQATAPRQSRSGQVLGGLLGGIAGSYLQGSGWGSGSQGGGFNWW